MFWRHRLACSLTSIAISPTVTDQNVVLSEHGLHSLMRKLASLISFKSTQLKFVAVNTPVPAPSPPTKLNYEFSWYKIWVWVSELSSCTHCCWWCLAHLDVLPFLSPIISSSMTLPCRYSLCCVPISHQHSWIKALNYFFGFYGRSDAITANPELCLIAVPVCTAFGQSGVNTRPFSPTLPVMDNLALFLMASEKVS